MVAQCRSERWISDTKITETAVLRRDSVSTGMNAQGIGEGPQTSHTSVTDASVLTVESVITRIGRKSHCNGSASYACMSLINDLINNTLL